MTDPWVKAVPPENRPVDIGTRTRAGLTLRVEASGRKTWVVRYVFRGRLKRYTIGPYPEVTLSKAASERKAIRGGAHLGTDAQGERAKVRLGETLEDVCERWLKSEDVRHWRPAEQDWVRNTAEPPDPPSASDGGSSRRSRAPTCRTSSIAPRPAAACTPATAVSRSLGCLRLGRETRPDRGLAVRRHREAPRAQEDEGLLGRGRSATCSRPSSGRRYATTCGSFFLTGARRDEALGVRWQDLDLDRGVWTIPPTPTKTGETRLEARRLPCRRRRPRSSPTRRR